VALSTHDTYAHALANTGIQCYVGTDGKLYAGAGAVALSSAGVLIKGAKLTLQDSGGAHGASLYVDTSGYLRVDSWTAMKANVIIPISNETLELGDASARWKWMYGSPILTSSPGGATEGLLKASLGGANDIQIYSNGAYRNNG
jgi:hypothetical protein